MNKLITIAISFLVVLIMGVSCDNMNDIQSQFADREEIVYLGKVDSLKVVPGFGRAKITWYVSADPKIEKTVIYFNMRQDSIVKDFVRKTFGIQKDSIIIEDLGEKSTLYEFRNINSKGESSLYSSVMVYAWGQNFARDLRARKLVSRSFDYDLSEYTLGLTPAVTGDSVEYTQVLYTDKNNEKKSIKIERGTNEVVLSNFADGGEFQYRNVFFLPQGMDTVYGDYQTYTAPKATFEKGIKLALVGNPASRYFERGGKSLYEWNAQGDVIVYTLNADGSFTQTEKYEGIVPHTTYREFFFYDDDKFIAISTGNLVSMQQIVDGKLVTVKTPDGKDTFGSSFNMVKFIPVKGYFYSIASNGDLRSWFANNNATFVSANLGATVAKNFTYEPVIMYNSQHLVGVDASGHLWSIPVPATGVPGGKNKIGSGWKQFVKLVSVGTKLLALKANGEFYAFDFDAVDKYWILD